MPARGELESPIICGRRNCTRCTRWKHTVDFRWRWPKRKKTGRANHPTIETVCAACRRQEDRERWSGKSHAERAAKIKSDYNRRYEGIKEREKRLQRRIKNVNAVAPIKRGDPNTYLPIMPFRLWLLRQTRYGHTITAIARAADVDEAQVRRWAEGIYWESDCNPQPIHHITLGNVDKLLNAMGEAADVLDELYPYIEEK